VILLGVSYITQGLYAIVFCTRYLDVFAERSAWNLFFKVFYIISSLYILGLMQWVFPRTRERELSWKMGAGILGGSLVLSPFIMFIFEPKKWWAFKVWMWNFSEILESVCVLPQLLLLRQTTVPTVIDSYYLVTLGGYRILYALNWMYRGLDPSTRPPNAVSVIFGLLQCALFIDFAWVYYTRQRVKLRGGGIIDADDMRRGWILGRIFGKHANTDAEDDEEAGLNAAAHGQTPQPSRAKWGSRGISVSADDPELEAARSSRPVDEFDGAVDPDAKMRDPDDLAKVLDDSDDDDDALPSVREGSNGESSGVGNGSEWRA